MTNYLHKKTGKDNIDMAGTILEYKCPSCGGAIEFDSSSQKMKCPYCDCEFDVEALKYHDEELSKPVQEDNMHWDTQAGSAWSQGETDNMAVFTCNSCGGEIVSDENTGATSCPYCGNPVVMTGRFSGALKPDYVIPFKLDKQAAKDGLNNHLKGKTLLPKIFKSQNHIDEIKGVYVPFWLFDADSSGSVRYKCTRLRHWSDRNYDYTETSFFSVLREGSVGFERVPVDGSSQMPDDLMESIEPFDFSEAVDFQTAYLAGYLADKYDVTAEQSIDRANTRIKTSTEDTFASTIDPTYATKTVEQSNISLSNSKAKYALYPVWLLNTTYKDKHYLFAMNGQTGKFVGDLPLDKGAYWKWRMIFTAILAAVGFGIFWLYKFLG